MAPFGKALRRLCQGGQGFATALPTLCQRGSKLCHSFAKALPNSRKTRRVWQGFAQSLGKEGQSFGKARAGLWQSLGKALAKPWQSLGKALAKPWQSFGKALAKQQRALGKEKAKLCPPSHGLRLCPSPLPCCAEVKYPPQGGT